MQWLLIFFDGEAAIEIGTRRQGGNRKESSLLRATCQQLLQAATLRAAGRANFAHRSSPLGDLPGRARPLTTHDPFISLARP